MGHDVGVDLDAKHVPRGGLSARLMIGTGLDKIAFSTLLMGLIVGVQPVGVKLAPGLKPAAVVFSLDGKTGRAGP